MVQSDSEILKHSLKSLFLCCGSMMGGAVDALVSSYRLKRGLQISGKSNPGYSLFVEMARQLGVSFEEVEIPPQLAGKPWVWLSDRSTQSQRAWVPTMRYRESDFHVLFPFYLRYHLNELRKHDQDFPAPKIDSLYVVLIWAECFGPKEVPLSAMVSRDLVAWEGARELTAHRYKEPAPNEIAVVHEKVNSLSDFAQGYLGFSSGPEGPEILKKSDLDGHLFNRHTRQLSGASSAGADRGSQMRYALLVRRFSWDIEDMVVITKNCWALNIHPAFDSEINMKLTEACLILRLAGMTEDEIWGELRFKNSDEYYKWQVSRLIDIDRRRFRDPYDEWLKACDMFNLEPERSLPDIRVEESDSLQEEGTATPLEDSRIREDNIGLSTESRNRISTENSGKPVVVVWLNYGPAGQISIDGGQRKEPPEHIVKGVASMIRQQEEGSAGFDRVKLIRDMRYRSEEESQLSISNIFKNYPYIHSLIRKYKDQTGRKVKNRFIFDVDMTRSRVDNLPHIHKS